ncbi:RICIN domain-containing protein [Streptomyces sp. ITFR-16]|uniref:RICIN domain-containing protein n=1 Tax=Streptomyces sp. ITFR-16 TaxID=3075198 RepID=UPI0028894D8F|nr:RICIN domain-containing protein [Streptomyces sp. ITFR-16]WNI21140.1 RICIN domain-containing protein [Streptomyces sp. ITFR-16]
MPSRPGTRAVRTLSFIGAVLLGPLTGGPASAGPPSAGGTAEPPSYTVSVGAKGPWTHPDDSPAAPYTDKDGAFYYQSAHALYGADDPREWTFYTGRDFDTATRSAAISDAADPARPEDRNNDTTWRCDNSPTGREATFAPAPSSYARKNYCDLMGVWVDPDTGDWYGLVHNEFTPSPFGDGLHYDAIDYAVSRNQGRTWDIKDHVLTSPHSTARGDDGAFPHETYYYGNGDPRLFVDTASGYFYVYYNSRVIPKGGVPGGWTDGSRAHVARAPMSAKMAPGSWRKWYDGAWSQPGTGGLESNMEPVDAGHPTGYTAVEHDYDPAVPGSVKEQQDAGELPAKSDLLTMNIAYDAHLGLYIGQPEAVVQDSTEPQRFYATDDLATQKWRLIGDTGSYRTGSWYRWMLDPVSGTGSTVVGKEFRSYCSFQCSEGADGEYYDTVIDTGTPAAPVETGRAFTIAAGNGRALAQSAGSTATTSTRAPGDSALARWVFTSNGDGSYRIANAATRQLLGVDATSDAGRAWGARPTATDAPAAGPTAGQQWFVVPGSGADGRPTGTYRLVNRYSGLVIGLSADPGRRSETTPTRAWTDRTGNPVGGARTAAEQTLTLTAVGQGHRP